MYSGASGVLFLSNWSIVRRDHKGFDADSMNFLGEISVF
jgi:hypothetical protein